MTAAKIAAAALLTTLAGAAMAGTPRLVQLPAQTPPPPLNVPALPLSVTPTATVAAPMSVDDFACSFRPAAGAYRVTLIHPKTCCPVDVCFTLPCGCAKSVTANKSTLRIAYPGLFNDLVIRFRHDGTVSVRDA